MRYLKCETCKHAMTYTCKSYVDINEISTRQLGMSCMPKNGLLSHCALLEMAEKYFDKGGTN